MARLNAKARKSLPAADFAGPDKSFPMPDAAHARAALSLQRFASPATKATIRSKAKAMGVNVGGDGKSFADHHNATEMS